MHASSSPLQPSADGPDATAATSSPPAAEILARFRQIGPGGPAPVLTPFGRYCASVLAALAIESGVDEDGIRRLFARCAEAGYGFPAECEAAVLAEHAALKAS